MNWKKRTGNNDGYILIITNFLYAKVFWGSMTKSDYGKEWKSYINGKLVGEFFTEKKAMFEAEKKILEIKLILNNSQSNGDKKQ